MPEGLQGGHLAKGGHLDVLKTIPAQYREAVLAQCTRKRYKKGQTLWRQGSQSNYVAFLLEGKAVSSYSAASGKTGVTGFWFQGDILGLGDLAAGSGRMMTLRFLDDSTVCSLPVEKFYEINGRFPEFSRAVIRALSIRLRWLANLVLILETQNALERLASVLLALADGFGKRGPRGIVIDLPLTHEDLGAIVGVSRQFANVTLHALEKRGLIDISERKITVADSASLQKVATADMSL